MNLKMLINEKLVDAVPLEKCRCKEPNYLESLQQDLQKKHGFLLPDTTRRVTFFIEVQSSND